MIIHQVEGLVIVYWEEDVQAIRPKWETLYREDTALRDALEWCFIYVQQYNVKNWIADLSEFKEGLSEPDQSWATKHFNRRIVEIGIERFVTLITPQQLLPLLHLNKWIRFLIGTRVPVKHLNRN